MTTTLKGYNDVLFSDLFADTVNAHGVSWAHTYYCLDNGMPEWEFVCWRLGMLRTAKAANDVAAASTIVAATA